MIARDFSAPAPDHCWVGDITYVWTGEGWLYLAIVLDLYSRRAVGWSMDTSLDTESLTLRALRMALDNRNPDHGLIFHSDRGVQYSSAAFQELLSARGIVSSMSRRGDCWDNAVAESTSASGCKEHLPFRKNTG